MFHFNLKLSLNKRFNSKFLLWYTQKHYNQWKFSLSTTQNYNVRPILAIPAIHTQKKRISKFRPCWQCLWWSSWYPAEWDSSSGRGHRRTWDTALPPLGHHAHLVWCAWCRQNCSPWRCRSKWQEEEEGDEREEDQESGDEKRRFPVTGIKGCNLTMNSTHSHT